MLHDRNGDLTSHRHALISHMHVLLDKFTGYSQRLQQGPEIPVLGVQFLQDEPVLDVLLLRLLFTRC